MACVNLKKVDLLEILKKNKLTVTNEAVLELAELIEKTLGITLTRPITEFLNYEIRNRFTTLKTSWSNLKTPQQEQKFLTEITEQTCRFQIRNIDMQQDSLMVKYQAANDTKHKLENTVEQLASELKALKKKLKTSITTQMTNSISAQSLVATNTPTPALTSPSYIYVTQQNLLPQTSIPIIHQSLTSPLVVSTKVEPSTSYIQPSERVELGTKKTIKKILLQQCYEQMDADQTSKTAPPLVVTPTTSVLSSSIITQATKSPPIEPFKIKPVQSSPIVLTSKKINQIAPVVPTIPTTPVIVNKSPNLNSLVSTTTLSVPNTILNNTKPQDNEQDKQPKENTTTVILTSPIAPKATYNNRVNIKLTGEKLINIDLTQATTEFIAEERLRRLAEEQAKQKRESETKKLRLSNTPPFFSKIMKSCKRKNYFNVSNRQQRRVRLQIKDSIMESTKFLRSMGLRIHVVELSPNELENEADKNELLDDFKLRIHPSNADIIADHSVPTVNNILYVKDKWSISDRAYNAFRLKCHLNIPTLFHLKKTRSEIDSMFRVKNNEMGVFMSLEEKLRFCLEKFFNRKYSADDVNDPVKFKDNIIHLKLGADGTNIGRNLKLLNFTFTIINEGIVAKSATGNYTLGIFEIENENYAAVQKCFKELIEEMSELKQIKVGKNKLQLVYYLAADWKMLAHLLGIQSANSKHPCIWCKCNKEEFYNLEKQWSITDPNMGCRTHEEHAATLNIENKKKTITYGYDKTPIFKDLIPINRYMIDMLHLFLRVSDTLFNLLVKDCTLADGFEATAISKFEITKYKHLDSFQRFLNEKCRVKFTFLWIAETKKLTWRDLVGPEKIKLFENFNLKDIIPEHENFKLVEHIWNEFYELITLVKQCQIEAGQLKERTADWLREFLKVYIKTTVTPYMHAFVQHLHEFVSIYKDINAFNCQGLEKLNDMTTGQYFKGTNKHDTALHQIIKKRNRIEYLSSIIDERDEES